MIVVTGAKGVVGTPLCERLEREGEMVLRVSRVPQAGVVQCDLSQSLQDTFLNQIRDASTLVHCAPIWLLAEHLEPLLRTKINRFIVFSSTSVLSKTQSADSQEQKLVAMLNDAEIRLRQHCEAHDLTLTILRPSMIYGYGRDQNVMHLARFIRRYGVVFLVGKGMGKRQPVHADDLVEAVMLLLKRPVIERSAGASQSYNVAGGEVLSYRDLVIRIFNALDRQPRVVSLPLPVLRAALRLASMMTRFSYTPEMADRMNQDLIYDNDSATTDFGYEPRGFLENPHQDLPGLL